MICKFQAEQMPARSRFRSVDRPALTLAAAFALAAAGAVHAEKADRTQPIVMEADRPGTLEYQRQVMVFNGNDA